MQPRASCQPAQGSCEDWPTHQAGNSGARIHWRPFWWTGAFQGLCLSLEALPSPVYSASSRSAHLPAFSLKPRFIFWVLHVSRASPGAQPSLLSWRPSLLGRCQNFTLIWCSLGPELLNFLQNRVRKCTIYLITMNSWHFLALNCCLYTLNCLAKYKATTSRAPSDRKHAFLSGISKCGLGEQFARTFNGA